MNEKLEKVLHLLFGGSRPEAFVLGMVVGFLLFMGVAFKPFAVQGVIRENQVSGEIVINGIETDDVGRVKIDGWVRAYVVYEDNLHPVLENLETVDNCSDNFCSENVFKGGESFG